MEFNAYLMIILSYKLAKGAYTTMVVSFMRADKSIDHSIRLERLMIERIDDCLCGKTYLWKIFECFII